MTKNRLEWAYNKYIEIEKNKNDFKIKTFVDLLCLKEYELHDLLVVFLKGYKYKVVETENYIYAKTNNPKRSHIGLLAHLDTVFELPPTRESMFYDRSKSTIIGTCGLGADDRAGVYSIISILQAGLLPAVIIFTHDEEYGGSGASAFIADYPNADKDCDYLIQLDRRGEKDSVFYSCDNKLFEEYVNSFGWETDTGTFSDISTIAPVWGIAAVNLSVGYFDEHMDMERINLNFLSDSIERVKTMLEDNQRLRRHKTYEYIPKEYEKFNPNNYKNNSYVPKPLKMEDITECYYCGRIFKAGDDRYWIEGMNHVYMLCGNCKIKHHPKSTRSYL